MEINELRIYRYGIVKVTLMKILTGSVVAVSYSFDMLFELDDCILYRLHWSLS